MSMEGYGKRCGALTIGLALLAAPSSAGAATQIGQTFIPNPVGPSCSAGFTRVQGTSPGGQYASPANGVITAWSFDAGPGPPRLRFKVAHPEGGNSFTIVGESDLKTPTPNQLNTYTDVRVPVRTGDVIGFYLADSAPCNRAASGYQENIRFGDVLPGAQASFDADLPNDNQLDVSAVLVPTNTLTLGKTARNKKKGTATLNLTLPNPGELTASGNGVKASSAGATTSKSVGAGAAKLLITAKGKKKKTLDETGKVKVTVAITYTPTGGDPGTQSVKVKLKKRL